MTTAAHLYDLIQPQDPDAVEREVLAMVGDCDPSFDGEALRSIYRDVVSLFHGRYPGYLSSDAWYHDLEHTNTVFLCTAAMLYGAHQEGLEISARGKLLVLACALFHDVGLIRREDENGGGTGAQFTIGHEDRSIRFMERYFDQHGFPAEDREDARSIILCTVLGKRVRDIEFSSEEIRCLGQILGSADIVGQMADRAYLEKLLLLFREFREGGIPGYESELDLLEKTPYFYHKVVKERLSEDFEHTDRFLEAHARERWGLEKDPFHTSIERNLAYLNHILSTDKDHYREWLRRNGGADVSSRTSG